MGQQMVTRPARGTAVKQKKELFLKKDAIHMSIKPVRWSIQQHLSDILACVLHDGLKDLSPEVPKILRHEKHAV